jgi:transposase
MRSKGPAAELERRRRLAVRRVQDGHTQRAVAEFLGVTERTVGRWVAAHRDRGDAGLAARPQPGRPRRLSAAQERRVLSWLRKKPSDFGFDTELWTAARLARLIEQRLGVTFHPRYLSAWLAGRGVSPQKPARRAKELDPAAVERWLAEDWPRIQKKSSRARPTSS